MNSFKVIVGVAPNGVITYVSRLYPGSISDKAIVQQSGLLNHLTAGDMILADKGFLIQDIRELKQRRRRRQRERHKIIGLISKNNSSARAFYVLYISLPSSAKQQREMVLWRT